MTFVQLPQLLAVCRLDSKSEIPAWALCGEFFSVTKTSDELSIVCEQSLVPGDVKAECGWRAFKVAGTLDFSLTGVLASIVNPLAEGRVSVFAVSTFDTDFVLVKNLDWVRARQILQNAGFVFA